VTKALRVQWNNGLIYGAGYVQVLDEKPEKNRQALARLSKKLPAIFPPAVLARALGWPFISSTPRLAALCQKRTSPFHQTGAVRPHSETDGLI